MRYRVTMQVYAEREIECCFDRSVDVRFSLNEWHTSFSHRKCVVVQPCWPLASLL